MGSLELPDYQKENPGVYFTAVSGTLLLQVVNTPDTVLEIVEVAASMLCFGTLSSTVDSDPEHAGNLVSTAAPGLFINSSFLLRTDAGVAAPTSIRHYSPLQD